MPWPLFASRLHVPRERYCETHPLCDAGFPTPRRTQFPGGKMRRFRSACQGRRAASDTQLRLQPPQAAAQRRLGNIEPLSRLCNLAGFRDGYEVFQLLNVHLSTSFLLNTPASSASPWPALCPPPGAGIPPPLPAWRATWWRRCRICSPGYCGKRGPARW